MSDSEERLLVDFLVEYMDDVERGDPRPLVDYLQRFPGHESVIAGEYLSLTAQAPAPTDADQGADDEPRIGPYRIIRELGRGGQGVVFLAEDPKLKRRVALKVLDVSAARADDMLLRFRREAEVASRLDHAGLCAVYDVGKEGGTAWIAMRYVEGQSLAERIASGAVPPRTRAELLAVVHLIEKAARALHKAHEAGVVHRDVKPGNIMIDTDGEPVLLDFGFARDDQAEGPTLTATGAIFGTPAYMSPEQLSGLVRPLDRRTDVYSLGVTLYEALTHRLPFEAPTVQALVNLVQTSPPPDPRRLNPSISRDLAIVLATTFEKDPNRRYGSALGLAEDLRRHREGEPITARPIGPLTRLRRWVRRNPKVAAAIFIVFVGLAVGLAVSEVERRESDRQRAQVLRLADSIRVRDLKRREEAELHPVEPELVERADRWLTDVTAMEHRMIDHRQSFEALRRASVDVDGKPAFASTEDSWLFERLEELLAEFDTVRTLVPGVEARRERARTYRARSVVEHAERWRECAESIASLPIYRDLRLEPRAGLVPLRVSPHSGLWEFWHVESGDRPIWNDRKWSDSRWQDTRLALAHGDWDISAETGLVIVLLPGGTYTMGRDQERLSGERLEDELIGRHRVTLDPFFASKYELTQAQWVRCHGEHNPAYYRPGTTRGQGRGYIDDPPHVLTQPVENVTWEAAMEGARRLGLSLPTEAQWEYLARGGSEGLWWNGDHALNMGYRENVAGAESPSFTWQSKDPPPWKDWHVVLAPVGSYAPNPFGLYDTGGNVFEFTRCDFIRDHAGVVPRDGDGGRAPLEPTDQGAVRGGSFRYPMPYARSAQRSWLTKDAPRNDTGLRPILQLTRGPATR